jgi:hypothetical protein
MKKVLKKLGITTLLLTGMLMVSGCGSEEEEVKAELGQVYSLENWDIKVTNVEFLNRVYVDSDSDILVQYFAAGSGYVYLVVTMEATLTGPEAEIFLPPHDAFGGFPEEAANVLAVYDGETHRRTILQGGGALRAWSVANLEAEPGETIDGVVLFRLPQEIEEGEGTLILRFLTTTKEDDIIEFDIGAVLYDE